MLASVQKNGVTYPVGNLQNGPILVPGSPNSVNTTFTLTLTNVVNQPLYVTTYFCYSLGPYQPELSNAPSYLGAFPVSQGYTLTIPWLNNIEAMLESFYAASWMDLGGNAQMMTGSIGTLYVTPSVSNVPQPNFAALTPTVTMTWPANAGNPYY